MKKLSRKIILATLGVLCGVCCAFGGVASFSYEQAVPVVAETTNAPTVSYTGFADGWNMQLAKEGTFYYNTLRYDNALAEGGNTDTTNLAASSNETSLNFKFNGKTFYELHNENALFEVSYLQGGKYVTIIIPKDYISDEKLNGYECHTITIEEGTPFMDSYLPAVDLRLDAAEVKWHKYGETTSAKLSYTQITWNNIGYNDYASGAGIFDSATQALLLIQYGNATMQDVPNSYTNTTNVVATYGDTIKLDDTPLKDIKGAHISLNAGHIAIIVPLGGNKLVIEDNTDFYDYLLEGKTFKFNSQSNNWAVAESNGEINTAPDFVGIAENKSTWLALSYDTTGFLADYMLQKFAGNLSGFLLNGETFRNVILWGPDRVCFGFDESVSGANGYSHATLVISDGASFTAPDDATVTNAAGQTFTLKALTLYLVDGAWTTEKPADYTAPAPSATFVSVGDSQESNNKNTITLNYNVANFTWTDDAGNLADKLLLDDATLSSINGTITRNDNALTISWEGDYTSLKITEDAEFNGMKIPELKLYYTNGYWLKDKLSTPTATYTGFADGWNMQLAKEGTFYYNTLRYEQILDDVDKSDNTNLAASLNATSLNVKFNGKTFYELHKENALFEVSYMQGHKYVTIKIPKDYISDEKLNGYERPTITITAGTPFVNYYLPELTLILYEGQWFDASTFDPTPVEYTGIPEDWNNRVENSTNRCLILSFGQWGTHYLGSASSSTNLANPSKNAPIANALTLNGTTFAELYKTDSNVNVNYAHGYNYLYIIIPEYMLQSAEFGAVTLKLEKTVFLNCVLGDVTLYLVNGKWTTVEPAVVEQEDTNYVTVKDLFDEDTKTLNGQCELQSKETAENEAVYKFLLKNDSIDYALIVKVNDIITVAFAQKDDDKKLVTLYVNDQVQGSGSYLYTADEWFSVRIAVKNADSLSVSVAVDNYILIDESGIENTGFANTGVLFANVLGNSVIAD